MDVKDELIKFTIGKGVIALDLPMGGGFVISMVAMEKDVAEDDINTFKGDIIVLHNDDEVTHKIFKASNDIRPTVNNLHAVMQHVSNHIKLAT